ncbi:TetR/AcrR family transcriptional regulator [Mucilaginibacter sp. L196]|uniref:TetR/AcrR family transcriptional regulator n=1 Tax=Mucilaginibacter sp. L196 TaxID=1641870 RepID=UPI00131E9D60|nr:TetR/AcrR family transcriptional regulator [Mucilaginibacter sp. L196]
MQSELKKSDNPGLRNALRHDGNNIHHGQIIERHIRSNCISISEIARRLDVSRPTLYHWFETKKLSTDIIVKIGLVTSHDFSVEFPDELANRSCLLDKEVLKDIDGGEQNSDPIYYWMERYIRLLERINQNFFNNTKEA